MPFKPAWWLRNPHLQTLWATFCRSQRYELPLNHERFELPDGDFLDLHWIGKNHQPIVLVLHGFEGSLNSHYAKGILRAIQRQGWRGVFMHFRGCSGEPNRLARGYHSGDTQDVALVVKTIHEREPNIPIAVIGYSLGGNVLLKWLGETGPRNPLSAAIAISVPFELQKAAQKINSGFSRFYQWHLLRCVRKRLTLKSQQHTPGQSFPPSSFRTLQDFDDNVTAPLHGFKNAADYYQRSSSRPFLKKIAIPTLLIHSKDDPFMTEEVIPTLNELSSYVYLDLSDHGGHVGFITGTFPWRAEYWLEQRIVNFLKNYF